MGMGKPQYAPPLLELERADSINIAISAKGDGSVAARFKRRAPGLPLHASRHREYGRCV